MKMPLLYWSRHCYSNNLPFCIWARTTFHPLADAAPSPIQCSPSALPPSAHQLSPPNTLHSAWLIPRMCCCPACSASRHLLPSPGHRSRLPLLRWLAARYRSQFGKTMGIKKKSVNFHRLTSNNKEPIRSREEDYVRLAGCLINQPSL